MISLLKGKIKHKKFPTITILTNSGVGYEVFIPLPDFQNLPSINEETELVILYTKKEDSTTLYGFKDDSFKEFFKLLCSIKGIGGKTALKIFNNTTSELLIKAISEEDLAFIKKLQGIGEKTAKNIIIELKDKISSPELNSFNEEELIAIKGLEVLGYNEFEASKEVKNISNSKMKSNVIIQNILKNKTS